MVFLFVAFADCCERSWFTGGGGAVGVGVGGTPLPWHTHISLEVTIERDRGIMGGINKFILRVVG